VHVSVSIVLSEDVAKLSLPIQDADTVNDSICLVVYSEQLCNIKY